MTDRAPTVVPDTGPTQWPQKKLKIFNLSIVFEVKTFEKKFFRMMVFFIRIVNVRAAYINNLKLKKAPRQKTILKHLPFASLMIRTSHH